MKEKNAKVWVFKAEDFEPWTSPEQSKDEFLAGLAKVTAAVQQDRRFLKQIGELAMQETAQKIASEVGEEINRQFAETKEKFLADRHNTGKLQWHLVDMKSLEPMVQVLMFGANKYAAFNWCKGSNYTLLLDSLQRHINAFTSGEDLDPESGLPHIGHALCNLMFLSYMTQNKPELDDRFKG